MDKIKLEILINQNMSQREIARELDVSQSTIKYWFNKYQLKSKPNKKSKKKKYDWGLIQLEYDSGMSQAELQEKYGIAYNSFMKAKNRGDFKPRTLSESSKMGFKLGKRQPTKMSEARRKKQSLAMSLHNPGGRCKWYTVAGQRVQGTWEREIAKKFEKYSIEWIKVGKKEHVIYYRINGEIKPYSPDFYLPEFDLYIEVKGYWWGNDRHKMDLVIEQNPSIKILIVEKEEFYECMTL